MTWTGIDADAYAADSAAHGALGVRVRSNLLDSATVRTQAFSRGWEDDPREFSTPSNSWRTIPVGDVPTQYASDTLAARIRYRLDSGATSGISSPTDAGDVRLVVNGVAGDAETVTVTGTTTTEVTVTCQTPGTAIGGLVEIQFRSRRGSSPGTFTVYDARSPNSLLCDASFTPNNTHYEIDASSQDHNPPTLHAVYIENANVAADYDYIVKVWPEALEFTNTWPVGDGKSQQVDVYNLPAWSVYGFAVEYRASTSDLVAAPPKYALAPGAPVTTGPVNALLEIERNLLYRRPRVLGCAVQSGGYRVGQLVDTTSETVIAAGMTDQLEDRQSIRVVVGMIAADGQASRDALATLTLYVDQVDGGSASDSATVDVLPSTGAMGTEYRGDRATLHAWNIMDVEEASWAPTDTGADGDIAFMTRGSLSVELPDTAGVYRWRVTTQGKRVWVGYCIAHDYRTL